MWRYWAIMWSMLYATQQFRTKQVWLKGLLLQVEKWKGEVKENCVNQQRNTNQECLRTVQWRVKLNLSGQGGKAFASSHTSSSLFSLLCSIEGHENTNGPSLSLTGLWLVGLDSVQITNVVFPSRWFFSPCRRQVQVGSDLNRLYSLFAQAYGLLL